ncbi:Nre family DNA repair protein [Methanothermobacter sp. K4]|uniref:Nre family DNA repair protein n=1 Tax=Methanothermobacter sp. K4 TaxID=2913262 RepID=UPI001EDA78B5|nr:Nre family DNA repair protein [Methanothermobacter sp. K4]MCG2828706.1 Nre family DNA repair protein [Methanothermobacter sp. K4]
MIRSKYAFLKRLTRDLKMRSIDVGEELEGATPPSVFIGSWNYPRVYAGPMIAPMQGEVEIFDSPERWIPESKTQEEIIDYRLNLIRGKQLVGVRDLDNHLVEKLQEISLSSGAIESEAQFRKKPRGLFFSEEQTPHGPSAVLENFEIENVKWDRELERAHYDTDLRAGEAIVELHRKGTPFSAIQKALSVGALGDARKRRLVPTRWSITACDSTLADHFHRRVLEYEILDTYRVHEFESLKNRYLILLTPSEWQYEWMEAFIKRDGRAMIFSDHETLKGKGGYSRVGGCYYSARMAVLEALDREEKQAGAIILREAYPGYVPLGVFNVRENVKNAMRVRPHEFNSLKEALEFMDRKLKLGLDAFRRRSNLLRDISSSRQTTLDSFFR